MQILQSLPSAVFAKLCECTTVSSELFVILKTHGVITEGLRRSIDKESAPSAKAEMLYDFLRKARTDGDFPLLLEALKSSANAQAVIILKRAEMETVPIGGPGNVAVEITEVSTNEVAARLVNDWLLVRDVHKLAAVINAPPSLTKTLSSYESINKVIEYWVSTSGQQPTVGKLIEILKSLRFQSAAESLQSFPETSVVRLSLHKNGSSTPVSLTDPKLRRKVAEILLSDSQFFSYWDDFCIQLGIPGHEIFVWKRQQTMGLLNLPGLMNNILTVWASRMRSPSVELFANLLRDADYHSLAKRLETEFATGLAKNRSLSKKE